jgi:Gene product 88
MKLLRIQSGGNAKLHKAVDHFDLPSGHTCPFAKNCLAKAVQRDGRWKLKSGPNVQFRCFSASQETQYSGVREIRFHNLKLLRACGNDVSALVALICASMPDYKSRAPLLFANGKQWQGILRLHVGGDFYSQAYFDAWVKVARRYPTVLIYAYTKSVSYWIRRKRYIPSNFVLTASYGGRHDALIQKHGLRSVKVVLSQAEADALGLPIDHDDIHAMNAQGDFALLIHGTQPAGSEAGKAWERLKGTGESGYGKMRKTLPVLV